MHRFARSVPVTGLTTEHSRLVFGFNTISLILANIAVALRIYARRLSKRPFVAEDYLVFLALLAFTAQAIMTYCAIFLGAVGHDQTSVSPENLRVSLQILAGQGVCYGVAMTSSKWSICLLYKRLFPLRLFRIATYLIMFFVFAWGVLAGTVTWAFCTPIAYGWDSSIPNARCANRSAGFLAVGIIDPVTDLFILLLPLPVIYKLQMPQYKKWSLAFIFSVAI
ncbi:MAG: hypothetical protein Q9174_006552, partial [Haloplaca sp. 1 TL-2023]